MNDLTSELHPNTCRTLHGDLRLNLTAPRRALEPAQLANRVPKLAFALQTCRVKKYEIGLPTLSAPSAVQVFAAHLGVQRNHVTLETLPQLTPAQRSELQSRCTQWCAELGTDLIFTPHSPNPLNSGTTPESTLLSPAHAALGQLNLEKTLPHPAQFIGRDIATALPKTPDASALRQLFNASQMALHQSPLHGSQTNSLWFSQAWATDALGCAYLQGGLAAWWDALPDWDAAQAQALQVQIALKQPFTLNIQGVDYALRLECLPAQRWQFWQKSPTLHEMLSALAS